MKFLIIGFFALFGWSVLSTHIYVCNIKGLCNEPKSVQIDTIDHKIITSNDTLTKPLIHSQEVIPENLIIYFAFDKSEFNPDAKTGKYFDQSKVYLDQNSQARFSIIGYTDAIGSDKYNQALGYRRALAMQHYFENKGIPANRILLESKGKKEPADDNNTKAGRANNRRSVITIIH
jgi:outer membrane protein OmpA-like peptidoglycan-associated protein